MVEGGGPDQSIFWLHHDCGECVRCPIIIMTRSMTMQCYFVLLTGKKFILNGHFSSAYIDSLYSRLLDTLLPHSYQKTCKILYSYDLVASINKSFLGHLMISSKWIVTNGANVRKALAKIDFIDLEFEKTGSS